MPSHRKHIHPPSLSSPISQLFHIFKIPGQGLWIAGNVHYLFCTHFFYGIHKFLCTSASWWIHDNDVCFLSPLCHIHHKTSRIITVKTYIRYLIQFCIIHRIPDGILIQFHSDDLTGMAAGYDANSSDPAVSIQHRFPASKSGQF